MRKPAFFFEDFIPGWNHTSRGVTVSEAQILDFATTYDPQPFHIDKGAAELSPYGGLIASGMQTMALTWKMFYAEGFFDACSIGSPGLDEVRWLKPLRPGDTLRVRGEVLEARPSRSKPDRGILHMGYQTIDADDDPFMTYKALQMVLRRP